MLARAEMSGSDRCALPRTCVGQPLPMHSTEDARLGQETYGREQGCSPALAVRQRAGHDHILTPRAAIGQDDQAAGVVLKEVLQPRRAALHQARRRARLAGVHQVNLRQVRGVWCNELRI